ncbi:MAG: hypothetical protein EHM45_25135 [Desulfobacteraceae bacterium]|nr:MAG: hypothetical protein EHM45_25135 [Desulfobacteraceae bacterium]
MDRNEQIIEQYRQGDSELRLYMFLSYVPLRDRFMQISSAAAPKAEGHPTVLRLRLWLERLRSFLFF